MAEVRNNWEGRTVNELFPLRRFLGSSNHSSVFLTESSVEGFLNAAIKLVPVEPERRQQQLWQWKTAATFSHPHLMRLLDSGQCELDGETFLFVVMEYAEESLSQILPYRALGPDEVQELLVPTLDALAFLHREKWIQGQLKPSNFLVVNDQLKLAIDTSRPVGVSQVTPRRPSIYDPPESDDGNVSPASDVWALGVTMTEALTQYPPTWLGGRRDPPTFPTNLPPEFADTIERCLSADPDERPTVAQLQVKTKPGAVPPAQSQPTIVQPQVVIPPLQQPPLQIADPPPIRADVRTSSQFEADSKRGVLAPVLVVVVVVGLAIWGGMKLLSGPSEPSTASSDPTASTTADPQAAAPDGPAARANTPPSSGTSATPPPAAATAPSSAGTQPRARAPSPSSTPAPAAANSTPPNTAERNTPPSRRQSSAAANTSSSAGATAAVHEEIPNVSANSRNTIHGHVRVAVRVTVDRSGRVVRENLDNPSSSNYFNRVASEAARKWRFAAADQGSREWLLHFEFGREGTTVHAVGPRS
jgi:eukaryotic-like serine/threonine-protein kinase